MDRMVPAPRTKFLRFETFCVLPLVLGRRVISFLAVRALQRNDFAHKILKQPQKGTKVPKGFL